MLCVYGMRHFLMIAGALVLAACTGQAHESSQTTDTTVTPTHVTDTTVVQKKVDVNIDTVKKTHNKKQ
jgi:ABC-type glycerol-3-phosphate transport system substrate-binding protein